VERKPPRLVCVGAATLDTIAAVRTFPAADDRVVAEQLVSAGGGPAATAAVAAARLGATTSFVGAVGDDDEGRRILSGLVEEGVDVEGVQRSAAHPSGVSVVIVQREAGTRAICTRPVPPVTLPAGSRAAELVRGADWVHVDHLGWGPATRLLADLPYESRPCLSVDAGNPIEGFSPDGVDLFVPTVQQLARTYGDASDDDLLEAALADGARTVVATRGARGCVGAGADGARVATRGHPVEVVSTLGAGDVFHGALLTVFARGGDLRAAAEYADAAAALSCRALDGRSAAPAQEDVLGLLSAIPDVRQPTVEQCS
jgi:sulfofructose kinase